MAPTICSEKKRQTRIIATTKIRRHGQATQLNPAISNIVNFAASRGPLNAKVPASLRIQNQTTSNSDTTGLKYNHLTHTSDTASSSSLDNHRQQFNILSDNAVTSSGYSDIETSLDLGLAREILSIGLTATYNNSNSPDASNQSSLLASSAASPTSSSSSSETTSFSSNKNRKSSPTLQQCQERLYQSYSTKIVQNNEGRNNDGDSDSEVTDLCDENDKNIELNLNKHRSELQASSKRKYYFSCNDFDSDDDDLAMEDSTREFSSDISSVVSGDTDMETDDSDYMTSLDTEKSEKLKRGKHYRHHHHHRRRHQPLLKDKLVVKKLSNNNNKNNNINNSSSNTDGLLSIAIKTIKLVKRNRLLQQRLKQLQVETTEFIQSVMANPENRHFRENIEQKV